eukprot:1337035-Pyramimonas_sp.AAC.1
MKMYGEKGESGQRTLDHLKKGIERLFTELDCGCHESQELLADDGVTEQNMVILLGMIEQKSNEIMQVSEGTGTEGTERGRPA